MSNCNWIKKDLWLSDIINVPAYNIKHGADFSKDKFFKFVRGYEGEDFFATVKLPVDDLSSIHFFEKNNFNLIDTNVVLEKHVLKEDLNGEGNVEILFAEDEDFFGICKTARESFAFSRFHLDSHFSKKTADLIKEKWAGNFFKGKRGDYMIVARSRGKVVGFLQLLSRGVDIVIDLIAVSADQRNKGVASGMIGFAQNECGKPDGKIIVGTQIANIASLRVYQKCGFLHSHSSYVFHCHGWR